MGEGLEGANDERPRKDGDIAGDIAGDLAGELIGEGASSPLRVGEAGNDEVSVLVLIDGDDLGEAVGETA